MHDEERRFYIKEITRLRDLLDRVKESRRQVFAIGGYRPVRDTQNTLQGEAWRLPACEGSSVAEGDAQSPVGALAGPTLVRRSRRAATQQPEAGKAPTGCAWAGYRPLT